MIPILYNYTETAFTTQGLGRLVDARKCLVTEERNGSYELVLEYPTHGPLFDKLIPGNYILATHDEHGDEQPFEIYETSAPLDGWMTVRAWHISYKLNRIVVEPFTAVTCATALAGLGTNSMNTNPFTFWTNKTTSGSFAPKVPASVRSLLGGTSGSILDVYGGGEYEFDKFDVKLWAARGSNTGVTIRYGKNLKKLNYELDASNVYNSVVPFWQNNETVVYVDHVITRTGETPGNVVPLDLSKEFTEAPTTAQLEAKAQAYIDASNNYTIKDNITLDVVQLWQTEEYKNFQGINRIKLCDTVNIYYERFGINATAKVIKVVYDTLLERYNSLEFGEPKTTLAKQIQQDVSEHVLQEVPNVIRRTIITTVGTYPNGVTGTTTIENGTVQSVGSGTGMHYTGVFEASGISLADDYDPNDIWEALYLPDMIQLTGGGDTTQIVPSGVNTKNITLTGKINDVAINTTLINSGATKTFTVPSGSRHLVFVSGTVAARMAAYIVGCATNGTVGLGQLIQGASITSATATNSLTIGTSGGSASILILTFSGSPITFS